MMRRLVLTALILSLLLSCSPAFAEQVILLDFTVTSDAKVTMNWLSVVEGVSQESVEGNYAALVLDESGNELSRTPFFVSFFLSGMMEELDEKGLIMRIPYSPDAHIISLEKDDAIIFRQLIGTVCDYDFTCGEEENHASCPTDCPSGEKDNFCDGIEDGTCDPDCATSGDLDCEEEVEAAAVSDGDKGISTSNIAIVVLVILALAIPAFFIIRMTRE